MTKLTIEVRNEHGRRFAIDQEVDSRMPELMRDQTGLITLRIGFEYVTLPVDTFNRLYKAVDMARHAGSEYPDDWKPFYGLENNQ